MCTSGLLIFPSYQLGILMAVVINVACLVWYREADPFYNQATNDLSFVCNLFGESIWRLCADHRHHSYSRVLHTLRTFAVIFASLGLTDVAALVIFVDDAVDEVGGHLGTFRVEELGEVERADLEAAVQLAARRINAAQMLAPEGGCFLDGWVELALVELN